MLFKKKAAGSGSDARQPYSCYGRKERRAAFEWRQSYRPTCDLVGEMLFCGRGGGTHWSNEKKDSFRIINFLGRGCVLRFDEMNNFGDRFSEFRPDGPKPRVPLPWYHSLA